MTQRLLPLLLSLVPVLLGFAPAKGGEPLKVLATVPDLKDIAENIGGERIQATSLLRGSENLHTVRVRPSMMVALRRADVLLQSGSYQVERLRRRGELTKEPDIPIRDDKRLLSECEFRPGRLHGAIGGEAPVVDQEMGRLRPALGGRPPIREEPREGQLLPQPELMPRERRGVEVEIAGRDVARFVSEPGIIERPGRAHALVRSCRQRCSPGKRGVGRASSFEAPGQRQLMRNLELGLPGERRRGGQDE